MMRSLFWIKKQEKGKSLWPVGFNFCSWYRDGEYVCVGQRFDGVLLFGDGGASWMFL